MIKEKIVELKIDDFDDELGVDIMSLVDRPAIGVGYMAFAEEDEEQIMNSIIELATQSGELYDPATTIYLDLTKQNFSRITDYLKGVLALDILGKKKIKKEDKPIRKYKYTGPPAERNFCKAMMSMNKIYSLEEIDKMSQTINTGFRHKGQVYSIFEFKGGVNCKHYWEELDVFKSDDGTYVFISHGKVNGRPGEIADASNNYWRFKTINLDLESITDYPKGIQETAQKVLRYTEENGWGSCGTAVGKTRANQLAKGEPISIDTIKRMFSYLSRHKVDLESSKSYDQGCGKLMYDAWGGDAALGWSERILNQIANEKLSFSSIDEDEKIITGPMMIPNLLIPRLDPITKEKFFVFYSEETCKKIAEKFLSQNKQHNTDINHSDIISNENKMLESWIVENPDMDKSKALGFENIPKGTWMGTYKINNNETWELIKSGELNGFSISGTFKMFNEIYQNDLAEVGPRGGVRKSPKAPDSDTPNKNPKGEGTAKGNASGKRGAKVSAEQEKRLKRKADEFNEKESNIKNGKANMGALKSVFQRGLGAFNTSSSPLVKSAEQWAMARVNAFLYLLKTGRPQNPKYTTDYDLLPKGHPKEKK